MVKEVGICGYCHIEVDDKPIPIELVALGDQAGYVRTYKSPVYGFRKTVKTDDVKQYSYGYRISIGKDSIEVAKDQRILLREKLQDAFAWFTAEDVYHKIASGVKLFNTFSNQITSVELVKDISCCTIKVTDSDNCLVGGFVCEC